MLYDALGENFKYVFYLVHMDRLWGLVPVLLGLVVFAHAGPVGLWSLLYVNTT